MPVCGPQSRSVVQRVPVAVEISLDIGMPACSAAAAEAEFDGRPLQTSSTEQDGAQLAASEAAWQRGSSAVAAATAAASAAGAASVVAGAAVASVAG